MNALYNDIQLRYTYNERRWKLHTLNNTLTVFKIFISPQPYT